MTAYAEELAARLPRVAPDLRFVTLVRRTGADLAEQTRLPLAVRRAGARMAHFLSVYAPLAAPGPFVVTVHDLIHLRYPAYFKRSVGPYYAIVARTVCARAARVLTDDERTVADLERYLGVPPRKVTVIPLGADDRFSKPVDPAPERRPYFLYVGNHRPHKDLATLMRAWERLDPSLAVDLLLTGSDDLGESGAHVRRNRGELRFLGDVDSDRLAALYRSATALVHPALCEGFGLPMLEAATVGTPVIACEDAVPSVLRPYVATFPARDAGALLALMARALSTPGDREDARRFARSLTWNRCAERTADVYREVLDCRPAAC
jgi:glycosyltransferase involved in cell wall biosynthesis